MHCGGLFLAGIWPELNFINICSNFLCRTATKCFSRLSVETITNLFMFKTGDNFLVEVVQARIDTAWECHQVEIVKQVEIPAL